MSGDFIYNSVPYPSFTFPQTHPDRLATMATLYGMKPARPEKCRVLELGCGDGSNLLSFAYSLPESEFVGVDLSTVHIENAQQTAIELNVSNVSFFCEDVMNLNQMRFGEFDFIIAHGLFSWIPDFVREKVLQIYGEMLTANGVGYISYNALPGFHLRAMMREMMQFHVDKIDEPFEQVRQGINFLNFLGETVESESLYQNFIKTELAEIVERTPENIFHDDFSENNQPFYFHEFVSRLQPHKLQFLSEADAVSSQTNNLSAQTKQILKEFSGGDVVRHEQYLDFIKNRRFRSSLVCRQNIALERNVEPQILEKFFIASPIKTASENPNLKDSKPEKFVGAKGATFEINHPLTKAALAHLGQIWARSIGLDELLNAAQKLTGDAADYENEKQRTVAYLLQMFEAGFVKLHVYQPNFAAAAGEFPIASAFARLQARRNSESVTTLTARNLKLENDFIRLLVILLDGTRNRAALVSEIGDNIEVAENQRAAFRSELPELLEFNLSKLAEVGLLIC